MKKEGYYSSGQFARLADVSVRTIRFYDRQNVLKPSLADVSVRTIRFYDRQNVLKPSFVDAHGARFYTDRDLASLQQILLLKYLGFSLEEIRGMTIGGSDYSHISRMLRIQEKLVQDRIEQMQTVAEAIRDTEEELRSALLHPSTEALRTSPPASRFTASIRQIRKGGFPGSTKGWSLHLACVFWRSAAETVPSGPVGTKVSRIPSPSYCRIYQTA